MKIEPNEIYNGNCMELMPFIPDKSVDMILCDLPYGILECEWDNPLPLDLLFAEYNRIIKDNGAIVLTATMKFAIDLINANRRYFRYDLIWKKSMCVGFANSHKMPMRKHEHVLVFYKRLPTYNAQGLIEIEEKKHRKTFKDKEYVYRVASLDKPYIRKFKNYPHSILEFANPNYSNVHPTQKPVALFEYLIKTYTNPGETVLDNCIGSGTTAVACINTGREYIGMELYERHYKAAVTRVNEALAAHETERITMGSK